MGPCKRWRLRAVPGKVTRAAGVGNSHGRLDYVTCYPKVFLRHEEADGVRLDCEQRDDDLFVFPQFSGACAAMWKDSQQVLGGLENLSTVRHWHFGI